MIRVGYLIWSLELGGAEQVVIRLAAGLDRSRVEPLIICLNEPGAFADQARAHGIEVIALGKRGPIDLGMLKRLVALLRERKITLLHTHLWGANLWGRIAARRAGVPVVITEHNVDVWKRPHHFLIDRRLARHTAGFIAVSQQVREFYESRGVARGRWQVIYNGVQAGDTSFLGTRTSKYVSPGRKGCVPGNRRVSAYAEWGIAAQQPVVGLIGRLVPAKAPKDFIDAVAAARKELPELRAVIIGDGPLRADVEAHIRRLGLEREIIMAGVRRDVPELLSGLDAVVFSSLREGLSIAMLEAMAAGVPVIATRVGGTPELIEPGVSGVLVPPSQPQLIANELIKLLQHPDQAEAIRAAARRRVDTHFSINRMIDQHQHLYEKYLALHRQEVPGTSEPGSARYLSARTVCYVIDHLGVGGAQRQLVELVRRLPRERWRPIVIALSGEQTAWLSELEREGITVHTIAQRGALDVRCLGKLTGLLRRYRPAIVHTWLFTADTYGRMAAMLAGGRPKIICAMRTTIDDLPPRQRMVNRWLTGGTDCVTINVEAIAPGLIEQGGVPREKIRVIYNGFDTAAYPAVHPNGAYRREWGAESGAPIIAMVARLSAQKDHATLLAAMRQLIERMPEARLLLVGDGALRPAIERQITELGLGRHVQLLGERRDVWAILHHVDVMALSTRYEGCSNAIMEAMAAGKPVVATDVGGNRELVVDGQTGYVVPPRDPAALAAALERLLRDPAAAAHMGQAGRERLMRHFSLEQTVEATVALYRDLLEQPGNFSPPYKLRS